MTQLSDWQLTTGVTIRQGHTLKSLSFHLSDSPVAHTVGPLDQCVYSSCPQFPYITLPCAPLPVGVSLQPWRSVWRS